MIQRFRDRLLDFFDELSMRRQRRRQHRRAPASRMPPAMKGNMRGILVVKPPDPMFSQAVFVLRDDLFGEAGLSREELLRQAREAAEIYCGSVAPPRIVRRVPGLIAAAAASSALTLLVLRLSGLI